MGTKKIAVLVSAIALGLCVGFWWLSSRSDVGSKIVINGILTHTVETRVPSPNAFDYYLKSTQMLVDQGMIDNASRIVDYARRHPSEIVPPDTLTAMCDVVSKNRNALDEFRKGFPYEYQGPEIKSVDQMCPYYKGYREIARLLAVSAYIQAHDDKPATAINYLLDNMELGSDVPRGGGALARLVGVACQAIGRAPAWNIIDVLNAKETIAALKRVQKIRENTLPIYQTMEQERNSLIYILQQSLYPKPGIKPSIADMSKMSDFQKRRILSRVSNHYDELIEYTKKPYVTMVKAPSELKPTMNPFTFRADAIASVYSEILEPDANKLVLKYTIGESFNALFEATLALHAYKLQYGKYPDNLNQLAKYCKTPVKDPFVGNDSLRYKKTVNSYLLYSVGPDGVDNGGQPIMNTNQNQKSLKIEATSKGDIVAGVMKM